MHPEGTTNASSTTLSGQSYAGSSAEDQRGNLWSLVDDRLHGRWRVTIIVGCVLGLTFAIAAFLTVQPKYESVALIQISPDITPILAETAETAMVPLYQGFVRTQAELLQSRRVLERALSDEKFSTVPWTKAPDAPDRLKQGLTVKSDRLSELISVQYAAASPLEAQIAVNAIVTAYNEIWGGSDFGRTLETLRAHRQEHRQKLRDRKVQARTYRTKYGTDALGMLLSTKIQRLEEIDLDIETAKRQIERSSVHEDGAERVGEPDIAQLERFDGRLAQYRDRRDTLVLQFEAVKQKFRPGHPDYVRLEVTLAAVERQVVEREAEARAAWHRSIGQVLRNGRGAPVGATSVPIETRLKDLELDAKRCRSEIQEISADQGRLEDLLQQIDYIEQDLAEFDSRIMGLEIESESPLDGRISVAAYGNLPVSPSRDRRRKLAIVGLLGGLGLSFGIFFLLGSIDRRAFGAAQLRDDPRFRWLGVLPEIKEKRLDADACVMAAHCVHQLRNRIEAMRQSDSSFVLAVSSPYQGDGKTNIVMALGLSYAAAGNRTLLIDCDIASRSLSRQMGLRDREGVRECLRNGYRQDLVVAQKVPNLSVLAGGIDPQIGPEAVKRTDVEAIFEQVRREFDVVIIDTGPMLVSLESLPVASAVDGVVLSVRRGRRRLLLQECIEHLVSIGATYLGVVLNYADQSDCNRYSSKSAMSVPPPSDGENGSVQTVDAAISTNGECGLVQAMQAIASSTGLRVQDD